MSAKTAPFDYLAVGTTKFARTQSLLAASLFHSGGTSSGCFKVTSKGVLFMLPDGSPFAFLVANRHGERFFVSCSRQSDGRVRYMYSTALRDEARLGLAGMGYAAQGAEAVRVWDSVAA